MELIDFQSCHLGIVPGQLVTVEGDVTGRLGQRSCLLEQAVEQSLHLSGVDASRVEHVINALVDGILGAVGEHIHVYIGAD